jgi:hypothetical protein
VTSPASPLTLPDVASQLRAGAQALSPGASGLSGWLRERAAALDETSAVLARALADHRALPTAMDQEALRLLAMVRSYRVAVASDAILAVADELEELARALLADGDAATARAFCAVADRIDAELERLEKAHPGLTLLPSKKDPRVDRWQRVTAINASDSQSVSPRVDVEADWALRNRPGLHELDAHLDEGLARVQPTPLDVRHRHGAGGYEGGSEPTSLSEYRDRWGAIFRRGLGACAAAALARRQREVFLSMLIPDSGNGTAKWWARALAWMHRAMSPVPMLSVLYPAGKTNEVLHAIDAWVKAGNKLPDGTIVEASRGRLEVRFLIFGTGSDIKSLLTTVEKKIPLESLRTGWAISRRSGSDEDDLAAAAAHWRVCLAHGYSEKEVARLAGRGYSAKEVQEIRLRVERR